MCVSWQLTSFLKLMLVILAVTQAAVRLHLAQEESQWTEPPIHVDVSPSDLISSGLDLEEQQ